MVCFAFGSSLHLPERVFEAGRAMTPPATCLTLPWRISHYMDFIPATPLSLQNAANLSMEIIVVHTSHKAKKY